MNAELISVGTELLLGEILNTDAQYLSEELSKIGIDVYRQTVVGDNRGRLTDALQTALGRSDVVIASGGLGPTPDDLTKEVIAECMGERLILHRESMDRMVRYFEQIHRSMTENNKKQAMMPENGIVLPNDNGTAPGCIIEKDGKIVIMLPGPPNELTMMFEKSVRPYLQKKTDQQIFTKTYRLFGIGESRVAQILSELMETAQNPTVAPYAKTAQVHLRVGAKAKSREEAERLIAPTEQLIYSLLGDYIYSEDGLDLPETAAKRLIGQGKTISFAESCTGGMAAKMLTDISGVSAIFREGYVTYANEAKERILGVRHETLERFGAVSEETAYEMAEGVRRVSGADIGVSVTGIAGPDGGTKEKPVGLVYLGISADKETKVYELRLNGSRDKIRQAVCMNVFGRVLEVL